MTRFEVRTRIGRKKLESLDENEVVEGTARILGHKYKVWIGPVASQPTGFLGKKHLEEDLEEEIDTMMKIRKKYQGSVAELAKIYVKEFLDEIRKPVWTPGHTPQQKKAIKETLRRELLKGVNKRSVKKWKRK